MDFAQIFVVLSSGFFCLVRNIISQFFCFVRNIISQFFCLVLWALNYINSAHELITQREILPTQNRIVTFFGTLTPNCFRLRVRNSVNKSKIRVS